MDLYSFVLGSIVGILIYIVIKVQDIIFEQSIQKSGMMCNNLILQELRDMIRELKKEEDAD